MPSVPKNDSEARGASPCGSIGASMEQFEDVEMFHSPHFDQVFDAGYTDEFGSCSEEVDLVAPFVESNIDCPYQSNEILADKLISSDHARSNADSRVLSDTEAGGTNTCGSISLSI